MTPDSSYLMTARLKNDNVQSYRFQAAPSAQNKIRGRYEYELVNNFTDILEIFFWAQYEVH